MPLRLSAATIALGCLPVLAGSPPRLEPPRPAVADTLPTIVAVAAPADAPADSGIVTLPGRPVELPEPNAAPMTDTDPEPPPPRLRRPYAPQRSVETPVATPLLPEPPRVGFDLVSLVRRTPPGIGTARPLPSPRPSSAPGGEWETDSALYLQRRLGKWTETDAARLMGEPSRSRDALDAKKMPDGRIVAFADPSRRYREFELDFDAKTGLLRAVFVYPWKMRWDECRRLWGANVTTAEATNGRRFHSYENRRLDVLVDRTGNVISLGLY